MRASFVISRSSPGISPLENTSTSYRSSSCARRPRLIGDKVERIARTTSSAFRPDVLIRATGDEPLGFLCMVDAERDKPQLPSDEDLAQLKANPQIAAFLRDAPEAD